MWVGRSRILPLVLLPILALGACDLPRRVVPSSQSAPPLRPGLIDIDAPPPARSEPPRDPNRPTLPDAAAAEVASLELEGLARIDLRAEREAGTMSIATNDPSIDGAIGLVMDGSVDSLVRSDDVNPVVLTLTFDRAIRLRAARVYLAGSPYDWVLEASEGSRLLTSDIPQRVWSQIDLPEAVETNVVKIEALRLERDDVVHVNEIELWVEKSGS